LKLEVRKYFNRFSIFCVWFSMQYVTVITQLDIRLQLVLWWNDWTKDGSGRIKKDLGKEHVSDIKILTSTWMNEWIRCMVMQVDSRRCNVSHSKSGRNQRITYTSYIEDYIFGLTAIVINIKSCCSVTNFSQNWLISFVWFFVWSN